MTDAVARGRNTPRLIECQPVLDPVTESLEAEPRVAHIVLNALLLMQKPPVTMVQFLG